MTDMESKRNLELPINSGATIGFGLGVIAIFIGGFLLWAVWAPLSEAVVAIGTVKVDSSRKQIQHLEGGIVKEILVRDGDRVREGQVLIRLDETTAAASVAILRDRYDVAIAQEARLLAERDNLPELPLPESLSGRSSDPKVGGIIHSQYIMWEARKSSLDGEREILEKQVVQLREDIVGINGQINAKERQIAFVGDELEGVRELREKGIVGKQRLLELERENAELEGDKAELISRKGATYTEISRKELEMFQVEKNFRQGVVDELKEVQSEIYDLKERLNAAEHVFSHSEVRSPVDGIVVESGLHTIGGVIAPGDTLLELVPENDKLIVEARIHPDDIDRVKNGLPSGIKITSYNHRTTSELEGIVIYVSADSIQDPRDERVYFLARIEVSEEELKELGDRKIQPGMMAEVFVRTGQRTMAQYLIQPLTDSFRRAWLEE